MMKIGELIELLKQFPPEQDLYFDVHDGGLSELRVEPVTESCQNPEVVGYVITDQSKMIHH